MQINRLNNKGFGKKDTMIGLLLVIIFIGVVAYLFTNTNDTTKHSNFRRTASSFVSDAGALRDAEPLFEEGAYLYDVIKQGYTRNITSPYNSEEYCDQYESRIKMRNNTTYLTFKCSDYIIYNQSTTSGTYKIYKVSEWTDEKIAGDNVQMVTFYNYEVDGSEQLPSYYIEKEFLVKYTENTGFRTYNVNYLDSNHKLLKKTYYRTMDEVE